MWKQISVFALCVAALAGPAGPSWSREKPADGQAKEFAFDDSEALAGWTVTGDVAVDATKGRQGKGGALKVAPGGKALLKLRERDESGKVEVWVYDDGTTPQDVKAHRIGPRWGLVQGDGKVLAVGVLYANYLGGDEGYTATSRPVIVYTKKDAPATPKLDELPLWQSVSQHGITWTFEKPARVGRFIGGDWYVVGPVTVAAIEPKPLYGDEIPRRELDHMDKERSPEHRVRNGLMVNPPAEMKVAYDSGVRNWFDPSLIQRPPVLPQGQLR